MNERRLLPRWEIKKEAKVWLPGMPLSEGFSHGTIEDVHLKGMRVSLNRRLPPRHEAVSMTFAIEDEYDFIKVETQIPWMREGLDRYIYGLSFSKIDDDDKGKLYQHINANCYDQFRNERWAGDTQLQKREDSFNKTLLWLRKVGGRNGRT